MEKLFSRWLSSNTKRRIRLMAADKDVSDKSDDCRRNSLKIKYLFSSNSRKEVEETVSNPEKLASETHPVVSVAGLAQSHSFSESEYIHPRLSTSYWMGSDSKEEVIPISVEDDHYGAGSLTSRSSGSNSVTFEEGLANSGAEEKHRLLSERVRYLAEQNVLLQKEVSEAKSSLTCSEQQVRHLRQNLSELQEKYRSAEEELNCFRMDFENAVMTSKDNALLKIELQAEELLTSLMKKNLHARELKVQQLQAEIAGLNNHSRKSEDFLVKKDEMMTELWSTKEILVKVAEERDMVWEEVNKYKEMNMLLKKKVEELEEEVMVKEGEITILRDNFREKRPSLSLLSG